MSNKEKIQELLAAENEQQFLAKLQDPSWKAAWEEFLTQETSSQQEFSQKLRWRLFCFTEKELDDYLIGQADPELCHCIENDPDYLQWKNEADASFSEQDEAQIQEILKELHAPKIVPGPLPEILVFCWDEHGTEVIRDGRTGKILWVVSPGEIGSPAARNAREFAEASPVFSAAAAAADRGVKTPAPTQDMPQGKPKHWEYSLPQGQGKLVVKRLSDGTFTLQLKELSSEYDEASLLLQGKTAGGKSYQQKKPVIQKNCVWQGLPEGEYTLTVEKAGKQFPFMQQQIHLGRKP